MVKEIKLSQNKVALVDDDMYDYLMRWSWRAKKFGKYSWYALRHETGKTHKTRKTISMHREILNTPTGKDTDHINLNGLDNRKCNLRVATRSQNQANCPVQKNNTSGYKGVTWRKDCKKWMAQIQYNGKLYHLGYFEDKNQGALVYNVAARHLFGEYAYLNELRRDAPLKI